METTEHTEYTEMNGHKKAQEAQNEFMKPRNLILNLLVHFVRLRGHSVFSVVKNQW